MTDQEKQIDYQLRQIALSEALKAISLGAKENLLTLADRFYKFLKGESNA